MKAPAARCECDLVVVGGGPAGMIAAGRAAQRGRRVLLLERGPSLGRKLLLTASGRCNLTNTAPVADFLRAFGRQGDFLRPALAAFDGVKLRHWLRERGIETIEERNGRVFPASQDARTVLAALAAYLASSRVEVQLNRRVESLALDGDRLAGVVADGRLCRAPAVLIATGGLSYPQTGSSGDGHALARQAGHRVVPTFPAIIAFETREDWPRRLQGTPIKNASFRAVGRRGADAERALGESFGEALWTHYGLSGPAVFDLSRKVVLALRQGQEVRLVLDLRPADSDESLDERLLHAIKKSGKSLLKTVLADWVSERTAAALLELAGVEPRKKMSQCSRSDRRKLVRLLKRLEVHLAAHRPIAEAIVTGGGVALDEVDAHTMQSRRLTGLFFAGEVLDLDGPTGGFNLQAAFSTGYLAGESV